MFLLAQAASRMAGVGSSTQARASMMPACHVREVVRACGIKPEAKAKAVATSWASFSDEI
jgi:ornithine cyclodeaminase/alanine dehydrogenase-like protein (mu-crystallin family)